jgi:hypothetical protein
MAKSDNPFRGFDSSPEVIQMVVLLSVRFPLSLRKVEDLAFERGVDIRHETVRKWVNRFGPMAAGRAGQGAWQPCVSIPTGSGASTKAPHRSRVRWRTSGGRSITTDGLGS